jgi:hypothetical protein
MEKLIILAIVNPLVANSHYEVTHLTINNQEHLPDGRTIAQILDAYKVQGWSVTRVVVMPTGEVNSVTYSLTRPSPA